LLSLCLSILAVALATTALLIVYDRTHPDVGIESPRRNTVSPEGAWQQRLDRLERRLDRIRTNLGSGDDEDRDAAGRQLDSIRDEITSWLETAEPRLRKTIDSLRADAEQARQALADKSEDTAASLETLRDSLQAFRKRVALQQEPTPPDGETP
jgi:hypothetical protein